jgi:hypothetical protein
VLRQRNAADTQRDSKARFLFRIREFTQQRLCDLPVFAKPEQKKEDNILVAVKSDYFVKS